MSARLTDEDIRALDALLDHQEPPHPPQNATASFENIATCSFTPLPASAHHLCAIQHILDLLAMMPAADPPGDLIQRTLQRIETAIAASLLPPAIARNHPSEVRTDA